MADELPPPHFAHGFLAVILDKWPDMVGQLANPTLMDVAVELLHSRGTPATAAQEFSARETLMYERSREYLGGAKYLKCELSSRSDVHWAILHGIPYASLIYLLDAFKALDESDVVNVLGISARTLRRQRETPKKSMPADLASKTWLFAETLAKAVDVFGTKERAEEWMNKSAMGLDGQRPIDLLQTVQGAEIVHDFLTRLEYGVYT